MTDQHVVRYYESMNVLKYPWSYAEPEAHRLEDGRRGTMDLVRFHELYEDIEENGVRNPFVIEWMQKQPIPSERLAIRTGNNRAEIMKQLGMTKAPALFVVPKAQAHLLPEGGRLIEQDDDFMLFLNTIWDDAAWKDSGLLQQLCIRAVSRRRT